MPARRILVALVALAAGLVAYLAYPFVSALFVESVLAAAMGRARRPAAQRAAGTNRRARRERSAAAVGSHRSSV